MCFFERIWSLQANLSYAMISSARGCCSFNGKYDDSTKEAVTEFQRIAGIAQDGIAGIDTCSHLAYWILQTDSRYKYLEFQLLDKRNCITN